jgi:hypothetical protein
MDINKLAIQVARIEGKIDHLLSGQEKQHDWLESLERDRRAFIGFRQKVYGFVAAFSGLALILAIIAAVR